MMFNDGTDVRFCGEPEVSTYLDLAMSTTPASFNGCTTLPYLVCDGSIRTTSLFRLQREQPPSAHVFVSERGAPLTAKSFHTLISRLGERAGIPFRIHPHMLRHACGFALANAGHGTRALQAWLGHRNIRRTVRYTELAPDRFKDFWRE